MILDDFRLEQRIALVTGASRGIGQAFAIALAEAGADIAGLARSDLTETEGAIVALGRRFMPIQFDLLQASPEEAHRVVEGVVAQMGRLDILVNNAGIIRRCPAMDFTEADWDDVIQVNLRALFFLSQAAARFMARQGRGKIINVASMLSFQGGVLVPSYTAAKSAVAGLTRALADEWAGRNVNVNAIAPGYIETENTATLRADPVPNQSIVDRIPAGRWGTPQDLKGVVVFLASAASDYMHGAIVPMDGGWLSR